MCPKIGHRSGDQCHAGKATAAKKQVACHRFQRRQGFGAETQERHLTQLRSFSLIIRKFAEPKRGAFAGHHDRFRHLGGAHAKMALDDPFGSGACHFDHDVDTVHERASDSSLIGTHAGRRAGADITWVAKVPARAGICCRDQLKVTGKGVDSVHAHNAHFLFFQRLPQRLEHIGGKLRQLIQKQNAAMRKGYLPRHDRSPASHKPTSGD